MDDENSQNTPTPGPVAPVEPAPESSVLSQPEIKLVPEPVLPLSQAEPDAISTETVTPETPVTTEVVQTDNISKEVKSAESAPEPEPIDEVSKQEASVESTPLEPVASSAPTPQSSIATLSQSSAQPPRTPVAESPEFREIQAHGRTKIQEHRKKKLEQVVEYARTHQTVTNDDIQKLTRVSDATATRYLVTLVQQGRLIREGSPRHAKYKFVR